MAQSRYPANATGMVFSSLTVTSEAPRRYGIRRVDVRCACGTEKTVNLLNLIEGRTKSCGCMKASLQSAAFTVHGHCSGAYNRRSAEHGIWTGMKKRCAGGTKNTDHIYSDRGIYVCRRWSSDFAAFLADMGLRPSPKHSIDRINNEGSYTCGKCPECIERGAPPNCRWATDKEQNRNTRRTVFITYRGETMCRSDWAARFGVHPASLRESMKRGRTIEEYAARHGY